MPNADSNVIRNPDRLHALKNLMLLDSPPEEAFDRLTRLASKIINAPVSLVSLVDADRQFFKSAFGLPDSIQQTPLSHSFCQHVVATSEPLVIEDARRHPLVHDNMAIPDLNVIGYLGMPLVTSDGAALGSFCVIDSQPRNWTEREIEIVRELAVSAITEIELRAEVLRREETEQQLRQALLEVDGKKRQMERMQEFALSTIDYTLDAVMRGAEYSEVTTYLQSAKRGLEFRRNGQ
jgi:GAF domain-containing protein